MRLGSRAGASAAACHGYVVIADDGWLGTVETPVFGSDSSDPDYLVVRMQLEGSTRRVLIPASLVRRVDVDDGLVHVRGTAWELARLPESLPLETDPGRNS